jgi:hypothetical protein
MAVIAVVSGQGHRLPETDLDESLTATSVKCAPVSHSEMGFAANSAGRTRYWDEQLMGIGIASKSTYATKLQDRHEALPLSEASAEAALPWRASLILAMLLSLALWAVIWAGVVSLASAVLG